ncbi:MAG: hypothetical protein APG10_01776 [Candidatus Methanofastidiosum methylothiophilum]|uniref:Uncharacterized protein n=1 Tax=Candidatus Methanofastidiosum methylothiophilum TaxID=1705564 RepID=A0A150IHF8_9EURY|nr:MAG: hypothetical protein APG10_01776 [Candidatus Methanofastidiosum methylthiophilus]
MKKDLANADFLSLNDEGKRQACRQMFYESTKRRGNRKETGTGAVVPWDLQELYYYTMEHKITKSDIERIFKEVK